MSPFYNTIDTDLLFIYVHYNNYTLHHPSYISFNNRERFRLDLEKDVHNNVRNE